MVVASLINATNTLFALGITTGVVSNLFGRINDSVNGVKNPFFK